MWRVWQTVSLTCEISWRLTWPRRGHPRTGSTSPTRLACSALLDSNKIRSVHYSWLAYSLHCLEQIQVTANKTRIFAMNGNNSEQNEYSLCMGVAVNKIGIFAMNGYNCEQNRDICYEWYNSEQNGYSLCMGTTVKKTDICCAWVQQWRKQGYLLWMGTTVNKTGINSEPRI